MDASTKPEIEAKPSDNDRRNRLYNEIQKGLDQLDRGEGLPGPEVFTKLAEIIASRRKASEQL